MSFSCCILSAQLYDLALKEVSEEYKVNWPCLDMDWTRSIDYIEDHISKWDHLELCFLFHRKPSYDTETDPSEGLMNVLKKIYEDGDDDMKRTINKAWVESREKQAKGDTEF